MKVKYVISIILSYIYIVSICIVYVIEENEIVIIQKLQHSSLVHSVNVVISGLATFYDLCGPFSVTGIVLARNKSVAQPE